MKYYLSICAIFRNESDYLREWIEFHRLMGVNHFYLYNNLSDDDYSSVLNSYVDQEIVTLRDWPEVWRKETQPNAYKDCLDRYRHESRWIAFIDLDEFLFAPNAGSLPDVLSEYERFPGIVVNWQVYGSSGHKKKPAGLVIENFTMKAHTNWIRNRRIKSIVDPRKAIRPRGPHMFEYHNGELAVTEGQNPVRIVGTWAVGRITRRFLVGIMPKIPIDPYAFISCHPETISVNKLRINHYIVKSTEEALAAMQYHSQHKYLNQMNWLRYHDRNDERDGILQSYVPELKRRLSARNVE
jgi:hypothetical protein